jgi:hypothetical protein
MNWATAIHDIAKYLPSGTYEKAFLLEGLTDADASLISWNSDLPITVETKLTGGAWETATSGSAIAGATGNLEGKALSVRLTLEATGLYTAPVVGAISVSISQASTVVFFGVVGIPETPTYTTEFVPNRYSLQIQSANALLYRRTLSEAYQEKTITEIIQDIFTKYIAGEGITLGQISTLDFSYDVYVAQRKYVADVLDELAGPVAATWHIGPDKKFYFLSKTDFASTTAPSHLAEIKKSVSGLDQRTVQIIAGAKARTATQIQTETWGADQKQIIAGFPLAEVPTLTINGTPATVGISGLNDEATYTFLWSYSSANVTLNSNATTKPTTGDTVVLSYVGFFEIEIENQSGSKILELAARTGSSGRIEKVETDTSIETFTDGSNLANELLDRYGEADETITCTTDNLGSTDLLTSWTFDLPEINITGDYIITERSITRLTDTKPRVRLVLKNQNYYTKYGAVFNKYDKNVRRLSVNSNAVIIKTEAGWNEVLTFDESWEQAGLIYYPTVSDFIDPVLLMYPMEMMA